MNLYEVTITNAVMRQVTPDKSKRSSGTQGNDYLEEIYIMAESEQAAEKFAESKVKKRRIIGIKKSKKKRYFRDVEIIKIKKVA